MSHSETATSKQIVALLRDGKTTAQAGRWADARHIFEKVLRLDPHNEEAILWWAGLSKNPRVRLAALARLLEINPRNRQARAGIRAARRQLPAHPQPSPQAPTTKSAPPDRRLNAVFAGLTLLVIVFSCVLAMIALPDAPLAVWAAFNPTATPTVTPTPTPTAIFTPTPTATATPTPTFTPTPTYTPSPSPTPAPTLAFAVPSLLSAPTDGKWIDIDLSDQRLAAYVGTIPVYAIRVSTGIARLPTLTGQFHIYRKLTATTMAGPGYYLPDVPWTMYYDRSYAIHGTYWHNNFGQPMSHGCVNLPTPDAKWLFDWAPEGTLVVIHN